MGRAKSVSDAASPGKAGANPKPPRYTADARRIEITAAAAIEFARGGLDGATTKRISERAGVSQPYVVRLFGTKTALFLSVANRAFERLAETLRSAATGETPDDRLASMAVAYQKLLEDRDGPALQLQLYAAAPDPEIRACVATRLAQLHELCGELSGAGSEQLRAFMAKGMLCNVAAALDIPQIAWDESWARERLAALDASDPTPFHKRQSLPSTDRASMASRAERSVRSPAATSRDKQNVSTPSTSSRLDDHRVSSAPI